MEEFHELVVWHWNSERNIGTARPLVRQKGDEDDVFFGSRDIVTLGEETLHFGSRIRARLIPDPKKLSRMKAVDIEIYQSEESGSC
jgi:cold shock CspA family protein